MGLYKFLEKNDRDYILKHGSLQFGRLTKYRLLELLYDDHEIGDVRDGVQHSKIDGVTVTQNGGHHPDLNRLADVSDGSIVTFTNSEWVDDFDCFVLCLANGEMDALGREFSRKTYDTCIEITDLDEMLRLITAASVHSPNGELLGKFDDLFERLVPGEVSYDQSTADAATDGFKRASAFNKRHSYENQHEFRVAIYPKQTIEHELVRLSVGTDPVFATLRSDAAITAGSHGFAVAAMNNADVLLEVEALFTAYDEVKSLEDHAEGEQAVGPIYRRLLRLYGHLRKDQPDPQLDNRLVAREGLAGISIRRIGQYVDRTWGLNVSWSSAPRCY